MPADTETQRQSALDCWYLTGATCSGKTRIAVALAQQISAEIISLDSMAIYRDMDLGTAKPNAEIRAIVPHHLIDIRDPNEDYSLAQYYDAAHQAIAAIRERGKQVLFVGGTPLYLKSLLRGLYQGPEADWEFRKSIESELEQLDIGELRKRLLIFDPVAAHKLHPNDKRRMIRALEVYRVTGEPLSHQQTHFDEGCAATECRVFALRWPREKLHQRINERVDRMFAAGLEGEVRQILEKYGSLSRTASQAVGYAEVIALLAGQLDREVAVERVKVRTRRFARRQETWFRGLSECSWFEIGESTDHMQLVEDMVARGTQVGS
jgi:tRNA dimethylallyltransferase